MGRGPKFSFPIPGRKKSQPKLQTENDAAAKSTLSIAPVPEWSPRVEGQSFYSKAERLLGMNNRPYAKSQTSLAPSVPQSPREYMTITVSEASFGSEYTDMASSTVVEDGSIYPPKRPPMSNRPSSNLLGNMYNADGRRGSNTSSISQRLHPKTSNSTMRSYYDPQSSPLAVSQQTSASAVRDMALRKGYPQVAISNEEPRVLGPSSRQTRDDMKKENRKSKPARLDISKLFPKPRGAAGEQLPTALLSPEKLVNSPTAMSVASDYFPRPMTREPTPTPAGQAKLMKKSAMRQFPPIQYQQRATSPVRLHKRDMYDNAKVNVRRPPRGVQHWFDALGEDSDEDEEDEPAPVQASHAVRPIPPQIYTNRKSPLGPIHQDTETPAPQRFHDQHPTPTSDARKEHVAPNYPWPAHRLNSPSQFSMQSQSSLVSERTKESNFSKSNLQDSSVLSMSSSEDESEQERPTRHRMRSHERLDSSDDHGEVIIGKAQAFEVRPRGPNRRTSDSKMSMLTTATDAATIEVMYTPEPYSPQAFPRPYGSRRSSHIRQPSVIPEDEAPRPKTSAHRAQSPSASVRSVRSSASEPQPRAEGHKLMAVTAEEEALLELMRRKRADMAKHSFTEGYKTALMLDGSQPRQKNLHRTSGFLSAESPAASPVRTVDISRKSSAGPASPLLSPPPRGRSVKSPQDSAIGSSILRDSSSCDANSDRLPSSTDPRATLAPFLSPTPEFSPLEIFPSPSHTPTASISMASPTTTEHPSPLPSPITPGLRNCEDVDVKVASSEPSCNGDNDSDLPILDTGVIDHPPGALGTKAAADSNETSRGASPSIHHTRRRTASSGADIAFSPLRKSFNAATHSPQDSTHDLTTPPNLGNGASLSLGEEMAQLRSNPNLFPKVPRKSAKRSSLTVNVNSSSAPSLPLLPSCSRNSSIYSTRTNGSTPSLLDSASAQSKRRSRVASKGSAGALRDSGARDSVVIGTASTRCSVSEDVLAAWGSLGGGRLMGEGEW